MAPGNTDLIGKTHFFFESMSTNSYHLNTSRRTNIVQMSEISPHTCHCFIGYRVITPDPVIVSTSLILSPFFLSVILLFSVRFYWQIMPELGGVGAAAPLTTCYYAYGINSQLSIFHFLFLLYFGLVYRRMMTRMS